MDHMHDRDAWLDEVQQLMDEKRWADAEHRLIQKIENQPFDARSHSKLGRVMFEKGQVVEGLKKIEYAIGLDADDPEIVNDCASVLTKMGRFADAREIVSAYLERNPWDENMKESLSELEKNERPLPGPRSADGGDAAEKLVQWGEEEFAKGNVLRAKVCFEMAVEKDERNALALNNLGVLAWDEGDLESALKWFSRALDVAPEHPEILSNSARALAAAGYVETALDYLEIYLSKYGNDQEAWKDYREFAKVLNDGWSPENLDEEVAWIYVQMGRKLREAGDYQGAIESFSRALRINNANAEAFYELGLLHLHLGQQEEAFSMFQAALESDPGHDPSLSEILNLAEHLKGQPEKVSFLEALLRKRDDERVRAVLDKLDVNLAAAS